MTGTSDMTWREWLAQNGLSEMITDLGELGEQPWNPHAKDKEAAWELFIEVQSRISTQPLHYRAGDEEAALDSIYQLFQFIRDIAREKGRECSHFSAVALHVLNTDIRPFTAKWHKKKLAGELQNDDQRREFRAQLGKVQEKIKTFSVFLNVLADTGIVYQTDKKSARKSSIISITSTPIPFCASLLNIEEHHSKNILAQEKAALQARREATGQDSAEVTDVAGLACSGGGIRSATFCLGVVQRLAESGLLPRIDYLSTVSGGGYLGAFLSSYLNDKDEQVGLGAGQLPFARRADKAEPDSIRYLRNNSKFLLKGGLLGQLRVVGLLLYGILVNLLTLLPLVFAAVIVSQLLQFFGLTEVLFKNTLYTVLGILAIFLGLRIFALPFIYRWWKNNAARIRAYETNSLKLAVTVFLIAIIGLLLPGIYTALTSFMAAETLLLVIALATVLLVISTFFVPSSVVRVLHVLIAATGPLLLVAVFFVLNDLLTHSPWNSEGNLFGVVFISTLLLSLWLFEVNINRISPHRFYRNRLAETYLLKKDSASLCDPQPLTDLQTQNPAAPYHLINCAINLPNSRNPELRGRGSDFFLFSRFYCGSPIVGYRATQDLQQIDPNLDLGTAMALSGAAASSYMGSVTARSLVFWIALFNVRLGYWFPNPGKFSGSQFWKGPNPFLLLRELSGKFDENTNYVNISDGGHIENLALYELLRRKCRYIIAIDGEADPEMVFTSLIRLIRIARIDFGIEIKMDLADLHKNHLGYSKAHFVLGEINYRDGDQGQLLYIKSSLTGNELDDVLDYQRRNPDFPHQSTTDQFFDEAQFEAYRALGYHVAGDLLRSELGVEEQPESMELWFRQLANSLLPDY